MGISIIQMYWFRQAFNLEQDQFDRDVRTALFKVAGNLFDINHVVQPSNNFIQRLSTNYYVVMVNNEIDGNLLEYLLKKEFEESNIETTFEYGIYDCENDEMVFGSIVTFNEDFEENESGRSLPKWEDQNYYFGVKFSNRKSFLLNRMAIWMFSTAVLMLVIIFFTYALFVILRQKRLSEIQKDFINNMTHEIKTPLSTIAVSAEVLQDPAIIHTPERLQNYVGIIQNENNRLKKQVERVLQIASMDSSDVEFKMEKLDLHEVIQSAINSISINLEKSDGKISYNPGAEESEIKGDRLHLTNVIFNLLDNAIKYCREAPDIEVETMNQKENIELTVRDKGIGIEKNHLNKIFNRFYRVPTGNLHDVKGFGLGLSYVKLIVKSHGGEVYVVSEPAMGSEFKLFFPLHKPQ